MTLREKIYTFSGEDYRIMEVCEPAVQARFFRIGLCVPLIFVLCFVSSTIFFSQVFESYCISIPLSCFFSWMLLNLYRLLLNTLTKNCLPHIYLSNLVNISKMIRIAFVCFIALVISKPIESFLYADALDQDILEYKAITQKASHDSIVSYYQAQIKELKSMSGNDYFAKLIQKKEKEMYQTTRDMEQRIGSSTYYLQQIRFLGDKHPSCWIISFICVLLFLLPVYLKHAIRNCSYYDHKTELYRSIIESDYRDFKQRYSELFKNKHNQQVAYKETHEDAPYNTIGKKDKRQFHTEENLLAELYNA